MDKRKEVGKSIIVLLIIIFIVLSIISIGNLIRINKKLDTVDLINAANRSQGNAPDYEYIYESNNLHSTKQSAIIVLVVGLIGLVICIIILTFINKSSKIIKRNQSNNKYDELEQLKHLMDNGIITEEEFNAKKIKILKL